MTREEALEWFKDRKEMYLLDDKCQQAEDMAIKALEMQPCIDCISRDYIRARFQKWQAVKSYNEAEQNMIRCVISEIVAAPAVCLTEKAGHWIHRNDDVSDWFECSECEYGSKGEVKFGEGTSYCPNCGAKME